MADKKKIQCVNCGKTLAIVDQKEVLPPSIEIKCSKCKTLNKGSFYANR